MRQFTFVLLVSALLSPAQLRAQLMLPGALQAQPPESGGTAADPSGLASRKPKLAGLKPPSEETILGQALSRDGHAGSIEFHIAPGAGLVITKLSLEGEAMSYPAEPCRVDVVAEKPIQLSLSGRPNGVARYDAAIAACPFSLEVLDGAVLVTKPPGLCEFKAGQCRVDPAGLWGPPASGIGPDRAQQIERDRTRAEADMRTNFRALLFSAGKDSEAIKTIAGDQAGFSSLREMTCRTYMQEDMHGFCALRLTQARALALQAAFGERMAKQPAAKPAKAAEERAIAKGKPAANSTLDAAAGARPEPGQAP